MAARLASAPTQLWIYSGVVAVSGVSPDQDGRWRKVAVRRQDAPRQIVARGLLTARHQPELRRAAYDRRRIQWKSAAAEKVTDGPAGLMTKAPYRLSRMMSRTLAVLSGAAASVGLKASTSGPLVKPKRLDEPSEWVVVRISTFAGSVSSAPSIIGPSVRSSCKTACLSVWPEASAASASLSGSLCGFRSAKSISAAESAQVGPAGSM